VKIGSELTRVEIWDVTLWVSLTWGQLKALQAAVGRLDESRPESINAVEEQIFGVIRRVEGLEGPNGEPITEMTREVWDALPAGFVVICLRRLLEVGTAMGDDTFPAGA